MSQITWSWTRHLLQPLICVTTLLHAVPLPRGQRFARRDCRTGLRFPRDQALRNPSLFVFRNNRPSGGLWPSLPPTPRPEFLACQAKKCSHKRSTFPYPGVNWSRPVRQGQSPEYRGRGLFVPIAAPQSELEKTWGHQQFKIAGICVSCDHGFMETAICFCRCYSVLSQPLFWQN